MRKMRRLWSTVLFLAACQAVCQGQIAQWKIKPVFDDMFVVAGTQLIMTDSLGVQTALWTLDGECLVRTDGDIHPFREGFAATTNRGTVSLRGLYSDTGSYIPAQGGPYSIARGYPYMSGGRLLVREPVSTYYLYLDRKGYPYPRGFLDAYPFFNGFASARYYLNPEKLKDLVRCLMDEEMRPVAFSFNGKAIAPNDLEFVSSVNDEGVGVVVAKKKVYLFHAEDRRLTSLGPTEDNLDAKDQAKLALEFDQAFRKDSDTTWTFGAKCGKNGFVQLQFDNLMRLESIRYGDQVREFDYRARVIKPLVSPLRTTVEDGKYGLIWDGQEQLAPQFEEYPTCFGDKAIVRLSGKYGMLKVFRDEQIQLSINKGKDIPFRHQTYETTLRLDFPSFIPAGRAFVEVSPESGCEIDRTSGESRNTQFGNYVQFNCLLHIPQVLFTEERASLEYPARVTYDGLISPLIPFRMNVWHYKYIVVDVLESETVVDKGSLVFTFNITKEQESGVSQEYPIEVDVRADSLAVEVEKYSETRYKCRMRELNEGVNRIVVQVTEQGCPPLPFLFEITYTKPVAKGKNQPAVEEEVVIKKKETRPAPKKTLPRVEM